MAKKVLTNLDLSQNELQNVVIQPLASAPTGKLGQIYYNSSDKKLYQHNGTQWLVVGATYDLSVGSVTSNSAPIQLVGSDNTTDTVYIKGAGGATVSVSGSTLTITTANNNTTYTFSGSASATGYTITITPSSGSAQTVTIGLATASAAGLMKPDDFSKLSGIQSGAEVNPDPVTSAELTAGTVTAERVITPKVIHDYVAGVVGAADAMRFKGTIGTGGTVTTLPTTGVKVGDTYRVITAGTYAGQTCEIGDLIIATATTPTWTVAQTNIDGAITSISGTSPISVTGSGSSRTVAISAASASAAGSMSSAHYTKLEGIETGAQVNLVTGLNSSAYTDTYGNNVSGGRVNISKSGATYSALATAMLGTVIPMMADGVISDAYLRTIHTTAPGAKGDTSNQTPGFGSTFKALSATVDRYGRVTAISEHTVTIPSSVVTTTANGLATPAMLSAIQDIPTYTTLTISAGQTSVSTNETVRSYIAYDASTNEEVVVDLVYGANSRTFSIASAYTNDIEILIWG